MRLRALFVCCLALALATGAAIAQDLRQKVDPWVIEKSSQGPTEFLVMLREQADLRGARTLPTKTQKSAFVADALSSMAARVQAPLLALLDARGVEHRSYWVANMIWVRGDRNLVEELAGRDDVFHVYANPWVALRGPVDRKPAPEAPDAIEWGVAKVRAPAVWALGYTGQGIVVAGADTGYQWDHPALKLKYRGWTGSADHNYNWHDSIHSGGGSCGADSAAPCDDFGHGTHTMGTMVGDDGASNQIGVAPGAQWIGCRNMNVGAGTPESYSECFQWFIAPTDLANLNPDPSKAPHVINNSWTCTSGEGCTDVSLLQTVVESTRAAGIEVVASAGNAGSACSTVAEPPAIYAAAFSIGATDSSDDIAGFSSRGPVTADGSNRLKPDISAPGVNVRSSVPGDGYSVFSGTSMAGPHVVGVVALVLSANADLVGNPDAIEPILTSSAVPRTTTENCGGVPGDQIPNNTYGWGRVDALSAFNADLAIAQSDSPDPTLVGTPVTYTLTVTNLGVGPASGVVVSEGLTITAAVNSATPSQGSCSVLTFGASCNLGTIAGGGSATVAIVATPGALGTLTSNADVTSSGLDGNPGNDTAQVQTIVQACPFPAPVIAAPASVAPQTTGFTASAPVGAGHIGTWTLTGGAITAGQGTGEITFDSGDAGTTMLLEVVDSLGRLCIPGGQRARLRGLPRRAAGERLPRLREHGLAQRRHRRLRRRQLLSRQPRQPRADGGVPPEVQARRRARAAARDRHALPRRARQCVRRGLDRGARVARRHGRMRKRKLLPGRDGHARADGRVPPEDAQWLVVHAARRDGSLRGRAGRRVCRRLDREPLRPERHRRLQREPAALLPGQSEHARTDGGVPDEDV